jgi:C4-dicarboxylate-binding protein DctP
MNRLPLISLLFLIILMVLMVFWYPSFTHQKSEKDPLLATQKVWNLRFGHNMPVESALHQSALLYAQKVSEKTDGKVKITLHPNQQLGSDIKMVEMARRGELDIILTPTAKMGISMPAMQYVDLPFYFPSKEDTYAMLDGEPGAILLDQLKEINLIGVTFWENGFKHFTSNTPLRSVKDFQGKKFRIMESRLIQAQFEAMGSTTLPIDFHKTRQALADGIVDAQENPLIAIKSMGIDEVQKHLTLSSHGYMGYVFCISEKTFASLPSDFQKILYSTARDLTPYERIETHKREAKLLKEMEANGVSIHTITPQERSHFTKKMAAIPPYFEEEIGAHLLAKTEEILLQKYGPSPKSREQIVIGLTADLSVGSKVAALGIKRGIELALEEINARGGVLGKPLVLIAKDNRGSSAKGVDNLIRLAQREDLVAVFGGVQSAAATETLKEAQKRGIPFLIAWASGSELTENTKEKSVVFRISANNKDVIEFMTEYLQQHYRAPLIMYENTIWGRDALALVKEISAKHNFPFRDAITFNAGQTDFEREIDRLERSKADSILLIANAAEASAILTTLDRRNLRIPIVSHWGLTGNHFFETSEKELKQNPLSFFQTFSFITSKTAKSAPLAAHYMRRYALSSPEKIQVPSAVAQAYDLTYLLAHAIQKARSTDPRKVRDALENLDPYDGVIRRYAPPFTHNRHDALNKEDYSMARYRADGAIIPITHH